MHSMYRKRDSCNPSKMDSNDFYHISMSTDRPKCGCVWLSWSDIIHNHWYEHNFTKYIVQMPSKHWRIYDGCCKYTSKYIVVITTVHPFTVANKMKSTHAHFIAFIMRWLRRKARQICFDWRILPNLLSTDSIQCSIVFCLLPNCWRYSHKSRHFTLYTIVQLHTLRYHTQTIIHLLS